MHRAFHLSCFAVLIAIAGLLQPVNTRTQTKSDWTPGALPMGAEMGLGAAFPVVKDQPYTAEILLQQRYILKDGTKRLYEAHYIIRRDAQGRLLHENLPSPIVQVADGTSFSEHGFVLDDPIKMVNMQWNDDPSLRVLVTPIPEYVHKQSDMWKSLTLSCPVKLGERVIHGVVAEGCRGGSTTVERGRAIEVWRSEKLRIELLSITNYANGTTTGVGGLKPTESRMEVTHLDLGEPDQTHFEPPEGYKYKMIR